MGIDIALLFALKGIPVFLWHRNDCAIAQNRLNLRIQKYCDKEILSDSQIRLAQSNISVVQDVTLLAECQLIVESIAEDYAAKIELLRRVAGAAPTAVVATNTSSLSVEQLATELPACTVFFGLHFFNPVLKIELVEIITCSKSSADGVEFLLRICGLLEKTPVIVRDSPGFVVNRLMACQVCQAIRMLEEGVASVEDIDRAVKLGLLHPIGPLALADLIGLDVILNILNNIFLKTGNEAFTPPRRLKELVEKGCLGRKTGNGFYSSC